MRDDTVTLDEVLDVTDEDLIARLRHLARADQTLNARLLVHLGEVAETDLPLSNGWIRGGAAPFDYHMGTDERVRFRGRATGYIGARVGSPRGFGTMKTRLDVARYRNSLLKLSAYAKTEAVKNYSGLWMRVDGEYGAMRSLDNMTGRPIRGTTE